MNVIIIDDEKDAITALRILLTEFLEGITIIGTANSVIEGIKLLNKTTPDIVFLDIEMPHGNGFDLLESLSKRDFHLVFTTAYENYAIKAIKEKAFDYLLKPIDIDELGYTIDKIKQENANKTIVSQEKLPEKDYEKPLSKISIALKGDYLFLETEDIQYIQSEGSYSIIYTFDKKYITAKNLKYHEQLLSHNKFLRISNSHLINMDKVIKYVKEDGGQLELQNKTKIPISRNRKKNIKEYLNF